MCVHHASACEAFGNIFPPSDGISGGLGAGLSRAEGGREGEDGQQARWDRAEVQFGYVCVLCRRGGVHGKQARLGPGGGAAQ